MTKPRSHAPFLRLTLGRLAIYLKYRRPDQKRGPIRGCWSGTRIQRRIEI